jgi:hypothetical protein
MMTYGFCPEDWPLFYSQLAHRHIDVADIERVEMRPDRVHDRLAITLVLRSGRVESWTQDQTPSAVPRSPGADAAEG